MNVLKKCDLWWTSETGDQFFWELNRRMNQRANANLLCLLMKGQDRSQWRIEGAVVIRKVSYNVTETQKQTDGRNHILPANGSALHFKQQYIMRTE